MRIFEVLGAGRKLLTYNKNIEKEDFYAPENVQIFSSISSMGNDELAFIKRPLITSDYKNIDKYSLRNWLLDIFNH
jgi:hypothetical protein